MTTPLDPNQEPTGNEKTGCGCNLFAPFIQAMKLSPIGKFYELMSFPGGNIVVTGAIIALILMMLVFINLLDLIALLLGVLLLNALIATYTSMRTNKNRRQQVSRAAIQLTVFIAVFLFVMFFILNWSEMRDWFETVRDWITLQSAPRIEATFD